MAELKNRLNVILVSVNCFTWALQITLLRTGHVCWLSCWLLLVIYAKL